MHARAISCGHTVSCCLESISVSNHHSYTTSVSTIRMEIQETEVCFPRVEASKFSVATMLTTAQCPTV